MLSIRDPVHGFVRADALERALIDTRPLQRLRSIRQLGMMFFVFPGAEHSRFSHALGAMELAGRLYDALAAKSVGTPRPRPPRPRTSIGARRRPPPRHRSRALLALRRGAVRGRHRPRGDDAAPPRAAGGAGGFRPPRRRPASRRRGAAARGRRGPRRASPLAGRLRRARRRQDGLPAARQPLLRRALRQLRPAAAARHGGADRGPATAASGASASRRAACTPSRRW